MANAAIDYAVGEATYAAQAAGIPLKYCDTARLVLTFLENYNNKNFFVQLALRILVPGLRAMVDEDCGGT